MGVGLGRVVGVFGLQGDGSGCQRNPLQGGIIPVDVAGADVTRFGAGLNLDDDGVTVEEDGVHAVSGDSQADVFFVAFGPVFGDVDGLDDVLDGLNGHTGGYLPDDGDFYVIGQIDEGEFGLFLFDEIGTPNIKEFTDSVYLVHTWHIVSTNIIIDGCITNAQKFGKF